MIGRGALSQPWIFRDIWSYLTTGEIPPPPSLEEKVQLIRDHYYGMVKYRTPRSAMIEMRRRISWWSKTMHPCSQLKDELRLFETAEQFEDILRRFLEWRAERDSQVHESELAHAE
jgi:tRNA-dihydrouridine synthase B